jgi:hypothetical protein
LRKEKIVVIADDNRDKGKTFWIQEMSAARGEDWGLRALAAAARGGVDIQDLAGKGLAGVAVLGIQSLFMASHADLRPLLDEMFGQIKIIRDPKHPEETRFPILDDDIEEIETRVKLRWEVINLHVNFSMLGAPSKPISEPPRSPLPNTPMSPRSSVRSSPRKPPRL